VNQFNPKMLARYIDATPTISDDHTPTLGEWAERIRVSEVQVPLPLPKYSKFSTLFWIVHTGYISRNPLHICLQTTPALLCWFKSVSRYQRFKKQQLH